MNPAFNYQVEAKQVLRTTSRNLLVAAPTGAGKTDVAFDALELFGRGGYVVPSRALAFEIARKLQERFPGARVVIGNKDYELTGRDFLDADFRVLTPFSLARMMALFDDFPVHCPVLVFDEFHNLDTTSEMNIVLLRRLFAQVRIVALSATIHDEDLPLLADWIDAEVVVGESRPVPLHFNLVQLDRTTAQVTDAKSGKTRVVAQLGSMLGTILRHIRSAEDNPVLVWTSRRWKAEQYCSELLRLVTLELGRRADPELTRMADQLPDRAHPACSVLKQVLPYGIGLHHGGMTGAERELVQRLAEAGRLREMVACYTLIQGVNLPTKHVIVPELEEQQGKHEGGYRGHRSPIIPAFGITSAELKQLAGRAGRPQFDTEGFCWVGAQHRIQAEAIKGLYFAPPQRLKSDLGERDFLVRYIPQLVARGVNERKSIVAVVENSFWRRTHFGSPITDTVSQCLSLLLSVKAVTLAGKKVYCLTEKGKVYARLGLHPSEFERIESRVIAGHTDYADWVTALAETAPSEIQRDLRSLLDFGFSVHHRQGVGHQVGELADWVQRLLDICEVYFELTSTPAEYAGRWREAVARRYLFGRMQLAAALYPIVGRSAVKRLVRQLGAETLASAPERVSAEQRASVLRSLAHGEKRKLDVPRLAALFKVDQVDVRRSLGIFS